MSRNVIVGLTVLVVAALAWIVIDRMEDAGDVADAPVDAPLTTDDQDGTVVLEAEADPEPTTNTEEIAEDAAIDLDAATEEAAQEAGDAAEGVANTAEDAATAAGDALNNAGDALADTAGDAAQAVEGAAEATADTAGNAATAAGEALNDAGNALADTASDAADATENAAESAVEATENAAESAADATENAVDATGAAIDEARDAAAAEVTTETAPETEVTTNAVPVPDVAGEPDLSTLLTPEGFDADAVLTYIDESELSPLIKGTLRPVVEEARNNPEVLSGLLEQLKATFQVE